MPEKTTEQKISKFCKDRGMVTLKLEGGHAIGKPDRAIWYYGAIVIETKSEGDKPRAAQLYWQKKFRKAGIKSYIVDNWPEAERILTEFYERGEKIRLRS